MKKKYLVNAIITALILIISLTILSTTIYARIKNETPRIFGYSFHQVVSPSMEPEIMVGDFVVAQKTDIKNIKVGDYVVFVSPDPMLRGMTIIHSVVEKNENNGKILLTTSGIKEGATVDPYQTDEIIGIYKGKSRFMGGIITFISNVRNLIFLVIIIATGIIICKYTAIVIKHIKKNKEKGDEKI